MRREMEFLQTLLHGEEKTILLAGHGASLNLLLHHIADQSLKERFPEFTFFYNATAVVVAYRNGSFEVEQVLHAVEPEG